jgi:hypothetical protein
MPPESFPKYRLNLFWHPLYEKDPARVRFPSQLLNLANQVRESGDEKNIVILQEMGLVAPRRKRSVRNLASGS